MKARILDLDNCLLGEFFVIASESETVTHRDGPYPDYAAAKSRAETYSKEHPGIDTYTMQVTGQYRGVTHTYEVHAE